jgi:hypothetical protein
LITGICLSAGGLAILLALAGDWTAASLALAVGLLWALPELLPAQKRLAWLGKDWLSNTWFGLLALGAVGVSLSGWRWWFAFGIVAMALAAWDLQAFRRRTLSGHAAGEQTRLRAYHNARAGRAVLESQNNPGASTQAESAAFERAHLRALGWVWLVGVVGTALLYELASLLRFQAELGLALGLSLALVVGLILLARLLARP